VGTINRCGEDRGTCRAKALGKEIFEWYEEHPQEAAVFAGAMTNLAAMVAGEVASVCDFSKAKNAAGPRADAA